jgi:hypothetical protein
VSVLLVFAAREEGGGESEEEEGGYPFGTPETRRRRGDGEVSEEIQSLASTAVSPTPCIPLPLSG